jgi:hypothetical protein
VCVCVCVCDGDDVCVCGGGNVPYYVAFDAFNYIRLNLLFNYTRLNLFHSLRTSAILCCN